MPGRQEGISRFAYEVLKRMVHHNPDVTFSFLFDRPYDSSFLFGENINAYVVPPQARHPLLWYTWFHLTTPYMLRKLKPNLFFSPEFYLTSHTSIPQIPVFHDIAYEHYPGDIGKWAAAYCRYYSPRYARKAAHVLTVSEYSRQDIAAQYDLMPKKISVVYNGASAQFRPLQAHEQQRLRDTFTEGNPYFYFVGTLQPRKNISKLLQAFDLFRARTERPVKLLLVGRKGWKYQEAFNIYEQMRYKADVCFTGFVSDDELASIAASAIALCYVPYLEGFGIPLLEAMYCDTPVICSNVSSMPEVAGEGALLVNPASELSISEAMWRVYKDPGLRLQLIENGRLQRQQFSWDKTYQRVWKVISNFL